MLFILVMLRCCVSSCLMLLIMMCSFVVVWGGWTLWSRLLSAVVFLVKMSISNDSFIDFVRDDIRNICVTIYETLS